jgi:hypothetical protein
VTTAVTTAADVAQLDPVDELERGHLSVIVDSEVAYDLGGPPAVVVGGPIHRGKEALDEHTRSSHR